MKKEELQKRLRRMEIPNPEQAAVRRTLAAATTALRKSRDRKKIKGSSWWTRLTGKPMKGWSVMNKPIAVSAGLAVGMIALVLAVSPNFVAYRQKSMPRIATAPPAVTPTADREGKEAVRPIHAAPEAAREQRVEEDRAPSAAPQDTVSVAKNTQAFGTPTAGPMMKSRIAAESPAEAPTMHPAYIGRDRFESTASNPVQRTVENPVSTFSIDVDTASYAYVRRALHNGHLPPKNSVRVEELINYFDYDYPMPADPAVPFRPTVALVPAPWNASRQLLHIGLKGYDVQPAEKPRSNLVFLLDVSGSMQSSDKLPLLKNAFRMLVESLAPDDKVGIVVYAGAAGTVLEPTPVAEKGKILAALERLRAGGSTAGGEGIRKAYAMAEANFQRDGINRIFLATDGDFNVGIRDPETLQGFVERKRESGVYLSVLGFGQGNYNDALMQKLAQNGNGNAAYIDTLNEARKVLVDEAAATLFPIANDVKIQVEFNPAQVAEYRLIGYETRQLQRADFNNDQVDAGEVGAGHRVTAIYEITPVGGSSPLVDELRYGSPPSSSKNVSGETAFLKIRYKLPGEDKSRLMTQSILQKHAFGRLSEAPKDVRFAAAVAAFGMLLRGDPYTGSYAYADVIELARNARGEDLYGYRSEFIRLVQLAQTARAMGTK